MSAGLLMLAIAAWVLLSAVIAALIVLVQVIHENAEELRDWSFESDDTDDWLA